MNVGLLDVFAGMGQLIDDVLAIMSLIGTIIMLFQRKSDSRIALWGIGGLIFGAAGQISMAMKGIQPKVGFFQMDQGLVDLLLIISFGLLVIGLMLRGRGRPADDHGRAGRSTRVMAKKRRGKMLLYFLASLVLVVGINALISHSNILGIGGIGIFALLLVMVAIPDLLDQKTVKIQKEAQRAERGAEGEEEIADLLAEMGDDFEVIHDIASPYGNIDHVVINQLNGIFLIETKSHGGKVEVVNGNVLVNGKPAEKDFIAQVLRNTYWLRDQVKEKLGITVWITPVLVFTNAFVPANRGVKGVRVVNQKYLQGILWSKANPSKINEILWEKREELLDTFLDNGKN